MGPERGSRGQQQYMNQGGSQLGRRQVVTCWNCGQSGHFSLSLSLSLSPERERERECWYQHQGSQPLGVGKSKAYNNLNVSTLVPTGEYKIRGKVNQLATFLQIDTSSLVTLARGDVWD